MSIATDSGIKYRGDTMEKELPRQSAKRIKFTRESAITDIASSLDGTANSVQSMSENFSDILKVNTSVVRYLQNVERRKKALEVTETVKHTFIKEKQ